MERVFWVDIHYACFGLVTINEKITEAPPIVFWMKGKTLKNIKPWLLAKKAKVVELKAQ